MQKIKLKTEGKIKGSREKEEQKAEEHKKEEAEKPIERIKNPENITKESCEPKIEVAEKKEERIEEILKEIEYKKKSGIDSHYYPDRRFYSDYEAHLNKLEKLGHPHVEGLRKELIEKVEKNIKKDKEKYLKVRDLIRKYWKENNSTKLYCLWMWLCHLKSDDVIKNLKVKFDKKDEEAEKIYEDFLTDLDNCGIKDTGTFVYTGSAIHVNAYELTLADEAIEKLLKEEGVFGSFVKNCDEYIKDSSESVKKAIYFLSQCVIFSYLRGYGGSTKLRFEEILKKFSGSEEDVEKELIRSGIILKKIDRDLNVQAEIPSYSLSVFKRIKEDPYSFGITKEIEEEVKEEIKRRETKEGEKLVEPAEDKKPEELEIPNFFELLLGKGFGGISHEKPVCIIVEKTKEKLEELIAVLCRDIYREKVGGKPIPIYRNTIEDLRRDWNSLVERKIIIIKNADVEKSREELFKMIKGFFSQDMGFLVLVTSEPLKLEDEIRNEEPSKKIVTVEELPSEIEKIKEEILRTIQGKKSVALTMSFDATGSMSIEETRGFGDEFKTSAENFDDELMKYLDYEKAPWELKQNRDKLMACSPADYEKNASNEHSAMKAFVWLYEWMRHDKRKIPDLETDNKGTDVRVDSNNYEIETLFGIGDVASKLTEKMKKYNKNEKVYFVLRNLDILRHLSKLSTFRTNWRKAGYEVEFFGLDLDKEELVPVDEFVKLEERVLKTLC